MSFPLLVRAMKPAERSFVLASWKRSLFAIAKGHDTWGKGLSTRNFWLLADHAVDDLAFPSCEIYVGCHQSEPETPICWMAVRKKRGLSSYEIVYSYARRSLEDEPELAAKLERDLVTSIAKRLRLDEGRSHFNPYQELKR